jgi:hypothetical protein
MSDIVAMKEEIEDEINHLVRKRDSMILEIQKIQNELESLAEKSYSLDQSKIRIRCFNCKGTGISPTPSQDGKKRFCEMCVGPDKPYLWADRYIGPQVKKEKDA